jgi:hypothetical protein
METLKEKNIKFHELLDNHYNNIYNTNKNVQFPIGVF